MAAEDPTKQQFDILRKRARQAAQTASQQEKEGLQRRFAQIGQVGSGAQIRAEAQAAERGAQRLTQAEEQIGMAEIAERQRQKEIQEGRAFASSEALKGRQWAAGESLKGRQFTAEQAGLSREATRLLQEAHQKWSRGERLSSQENAALEAAKQRGWITGERVAAQESAATEAEKERGWRTGERVAIQESVATEAEKERGWRTGERIASEETAARMQEDQQAEVRRLQEDAQLYADWDRAFKQQSYDEGVRQFDRNFGRDSKVIDFNMELAKQASKPSIWKDLGIPIGDSFGFSALGGGGAGAVSGPNYGDVISTLSSTISRAFGGLF